MLLHNAVGRPLARIKKYARSPYFQTLVELLLLGAKSRYVAVTTEGLAEQLGKSQQAVSQHIIGLEKEGYLEREKEGRRFNIKLTDKAVNDLTSYYLTLRGVLEEAPDIYEFNGKVFTGLGEGAYYVGMAGYGRQFKEKLGFEPFAGTLNLRLESRTERIQLEELRAKPGIRIEGFMDGTRSFGALRVFPAIIEDERGGILAIDRTHYDVSVLEVIAPKNLRDALSLKDGSRVTVKAFLQHGATGQS
jgi:riboflavin kinase